MFATLLSLLTLFKTTKLLVEKNFLKKRIFLVLGCNILRKILICQFSCIVNISVLETAMKFPEFNALRLESKFFVNSRYTIVSRYTIMLSVDSMIRKQWYRSIYRSVSQHPLAPMHYAWIPDQGMASWKGCSLRTMDYLYERKIYSNKNLLKTRRKQSVRNKRKRTTAREKKCNTKEGNWKK